MSSQSREVINKYFSKDNTIKQKYKKEPDLKKRLFFYRDFCLLRLDEHYKKYTSILYNVNTYGTLDHKRKKLTKVIKECILKLFQECCEYARDDNHEYENTDWDFDVMVEESFLDHWDGLTELYENNEDPDLERSIRDLVTNDKEFRKELRIIYNKTFGF